MAQFDRLFDSIKIGGIEVKNRIALAPMHMGHCTEDGMITDQALCHYVARVKGGIGMIIVEAAMVASDIHAESVDRTMGCSSDYHINGLKDLADTIHGLGGKAVVQLVPGQGAQALFSRPGRKLVVPSAIPTKVPYKYRIFKPITGETPQELSVEEIEELEDRCVAGASRIKKADFPPQSHKKNQRKSGKRFPDRLPHQWR